MKRSARARKRAKREAITAPTASVREFEGHPYFYRRTTVDGRDAFVTRGPEMPQPGGLEVPTVRRLVSLYVHLPEQEPRRQWFAQHGVVEYAVQAGDRFIETELEKRERVLMAAARATLKGLGLVLEEQACPSS